MHPVQPRPDNNYLVISSSFEPDIFAQQLQNLETYRIRITNRSRTADEVFSNSYLEIFNGDQHYLESRSNESPQAQIQYFDQDVWVNLETDQCLLQILEQPQAEQRLAEQRNAALASISGLLSLGEFQLIASNKPFQNQPADLYQLDTKMPGMHAQSRIWINPEGLILKLEATLSTDQIVLNQTYELEKLELQQAITLPDC